MFRYLNINSWTASVFAAIMAATMVLQIMVPAIAFGMEDITNNNQEQTIEEQIPLEPMIVAEEADVILEDDTKTEGSSEPTETTIDTDNATAGLEVENMVNSNEIDTGPVDETTIDTEIDNGSQETESLTTLALPEGDQEPEQSVPDPYVDQDILTINASNTATTTTKATTTATTGQNSVSGEQVTINTGDAVAFTDVLNVVNTNIVDSDGLVQFINEALGYQDFDLRDEFELTYAEFDTAQSTSNCNLDECSGVDTTITLDNNADIENNITVIADTGSNQAAGENSSINTGDAYASANVINVANTNITDSNYLLLVFNNFSSYAGDIVLPNSDFFDKILQNSGGVNNVDLNINNSATVNNNVETVANTGKNSASGNNTTINTGNAGASSEITNMVNQNVIGGSSFSMLIRVHGDWTGSITGLPDGLTWRETDQGIEIISKDTTNGGSPIRDLTLSANNTAKINNNVKVFALTGNNEASGDEASIETGNAYADSSILNIANTNIIGSNWTNLIFTIYGNWNGDLSFGQPNLWLGVTADSSDSPIMPGSKVTYTYTVFNRGDVTAPNVTLDSMFETGTLAFDNTGEYSSLGANSQSSWSLGDIKAGETREFTRTATVSGSLDRRVVSAIPLTSRVVSTQKDGDISDNEDIVTIYVGEKRSKSNSRRSTFPAHFDITKTASHDFAQPGDTVDYTVTFFNRGGQLFDGMLVDVLENEEGEIVQQQSWPFEEIKNWETITVTYSIEFDSSMATGTYTNYAQLIGFHESQKEKYQTPYESPIVSHTLNLGVIPEGQVLGISTYQCTAYLKDYLRYGYNNNPEEVIKLQHFLNEQLFLDLAVSGIFDTATEQAVRDFQIIHKDEILSPWGIENASGYVYYTTQKKINEIVCGGLAAFPLAPEQRQEIDLYREKSQRTRPFAFESTPTRQNIPETITPNVNPTPVIKQPEREPATETIRDSFPQETLIIPEPPNSWSGVRYWWTSLTDRLRGALR